MAHLLDVVTEGILMSHDFSKTHNDKLYHRPDGYIFPQIDINSLGVIVLEYLKRTSDINEIKIVSFDGFTNSNIYGVLKISKSRADIIVNSKLNACWLRFTICKELLQLYIDTTSTQGGYASQDIITQITDLVEIQDQYMNGAVVSTGFKNGANAIINKSITEFQAITMAIDLIFPFNEKFVLAEVLKEMLKAEEIKFYDIACLFKMPEFVIKAYYASFHKLSNTIAKKQGL